MRTDSRLTRYKTMWTPNLTHCITILFLVGTVMATNSLYRIPYEQAKIIHGQQLYTSHVPGYYYLPNSVNHQRTGIPYFVSPTFENNFNGEDFAMHQSEEAKMKMQPTTNEEVANVQVNEEQDSNRQLYYQLPSHPEEQLLWYRQFQPSISPYQQLSPFNYPHGLYNTAKYIVQPTTDVHAPVYPIYQVLNSMPAHDRVASSVMNLVKKSGLPDASMNESEKHIASAPNVTLSTLLKSHAKNDEAGQKKAMEGILQLNGMSHDSQNQPDMPAITMKQKMESSDGHSTISPAVESM